MAECPQETCFLSEGAGCGLGFLSPLDCPALSALPEAKQVDVPPVEAVAMPWSGGVLGLADLAFVAGARKPTVVAIVGPHGAGKTTLLAAWYLLLGRGHRADEEQRFSGSRSLAGWELLANTLRWEPGSIPPTFPPHTSSRSARIPGLLHLAFTRHRAPSRDYLMTDAPGEWFRSWAVNRDAPAAEGARWAAEHADAFLLVADREGLAGPEKGAARTSVQLLARRLAEERLGRPVALVWTKSDVAVPSDLETAVRSAVRTAIPDADEFAVTIMPESGGKRDAQGLLDLLRWVLTARRARADLREPPERTLARIFTSGMR